LYILQQTLFSFEDWMKLESQERAPLFFATLNLEPYTKKLKGLSPQGAKGYSREALMRALLVAPFEGISTFTALHRRLCSDIRFRYQCGFRLDQRVPSVSTFSRIFSRLTEKGLLEKLFFDLVQQCREKGIINGKHVAIDSSAIDAYEKKKPKARCMDGHASWGAKLDSFGNKITWFGYKIHLAVDTESELPIAVHVTPAHVNDGDVAPLLMQDVVLTKKFNVNHFIMDAGYDQLKNYETAKGFKAQAIIPLNPRNEKEPPAGLSSNGTPRCSMGFDMTYWGADGNYLKFRCPHVTGHVNCPHGSNWCSSSNYGMVVKIHIHEDLRRFSIPHRNTKPWQELYKKRTSVERCHSRLKEYLTANDLHVKGICKVKSHMYINAIVLLASALAMTKANAYKNVA
jgi:IS5 family transposase